MQTNPIPVPISLAYVSLSFLTHPSCSRPCYRPLCVGPHGCHGIGGIHGGAGGLVYPGIGAYLWPAGMLSVCVYIRVSRSRSHSWRTGCTLALVLTSGLLVCSLIHMASFSLLCVPCRRCLLPADTLSLSPCYLLAFLLTVCVVTSFGVGYGGLASFSLPPSLPPSLPLILCAVNRLRRWVRWWLRRRLRRTPLISYQTSYILSVT